MTEPARLVIAAAALLAPSAAALQENPEFAPSERLARFMERKLEHAQAAFAGLAGEDLSATAEHADRLGLLTLDEQWKRVTSIEYAERSSEFRRAAALLAKAARAEDRPAAELAWLRLENHCFTCHDHVRDLERER
jgi:hypothetical protein